MPTKIALVGNPNCGKTTLFNCVTNSNQKVGNWPGVTVEKKVSSFKTNKNVKIIDLPGIYSMFPYSPDEDVSISFLTKDKPDIIINVVSALNLERSLYLTMQILELKIPTIIAVSMVDLLEKNNGNLNLEKFAEAFDCEVFQLAKNNKQNNFSLIQKAIEKSKTKTQQSSINYGFDFENYIKDLENFLLINQKTLNNTNSKWLAISIFENNTKIIKSLNFNENEKLELKKIMQNIENNLGDIPQNILINKRYEAITKNLKHFYKQNSNNKKNLSDKIDSVLTNKWLSIPLFIFMIFAVYFIAIPLIGKPISNWLDETILRNNIIPATKSFLTKINLQNWLISLICNGIITGVGSVLVFVPQLFTLFFILSFLEDCGYMSRVAFITDRIFSRFGLCGQSLISFLVSSSCGVNGINVTKTIKNKSTRIITLITTTFVPCSAKIPIIAAISNMFLKNGWIIAPMVYMICFFAILICGLFLKMFSNLKNQSNQFIMEMTQYQLPSLKNLTKNSIENTKAFIEKALSVVLLASIIIWFTSNFGFVDGKFLMVKTNNSILATIGKLLVPFFIPLGFSNWQTITAILSGLVAKENIINTLEVISASNHHAISNLAVSSIFSNNAAAISFLVFNLLCIPCCISVAAIYKQTGSIKTTAKVAAVQTLTAYVISAITYLIAILILKT